MTLTTLELNVLDHIARNSYQPTNYGRPATFEDTSSIWRHSILDSSSKTEVAKRSLPGVCASLVKKGLIICTEDGNDSTISMTEAGFKAWDQAFPATPEQIAAEEEARGMVPVTEMLTADQARAMFAATDEAAANRAADGPFAPEAPGLHTIYHALELQTGTTPAEMAARKEARELISRNAVKLAACLTAPEVVPPQLTLHQSSLIAERAVRMAEFSSMVRRMQEMTQDIVQDAVNGRVRPHDTVNLTRLAADVQALAAVIDSLDRYIVACGQ